MARMRTVRVELGPEELDALGYLLASSADDDEGDFRVIRVRAGERRDGRTRLEVDLEAADNLTAVELAERLHWQIDSVLHGSEAPSPHERERPGQRGRPGA